MRRGPLCAEVPGTVGRFAVWSALWALFGVGAVGVKTARSAFVRDYYVRVLMDAVATVSDEMQLASLVNLAFGFASVQTTDQWLRQLSRQTSPTN